MYTPQWNVLRQTATSKCEGFLAFQGLTSSPPLGCCWWLGRTNTKIGATKPPATPWRWGRSQFLKRRKSFASWHGCLPENISLNCVSVKASRYSIWSVSIKSHYWHLARYCRHQDQTNCLMRWNLLYRFAVIMYIIAFLYCVPYLVRQPDETLLTMGMVMSDPRPPRPNSIELRRSYPDQVDMVYSGNSGVYSPRHAQSPTESHYK